MQNLGDKVNTLSGLAAANSSDTDAWQDAFRNLDSATEAAQIYISQERAIFGSQMNRVGYLSTNLTAQSTNLQNSRSSIIDTDFAAETAKLTRGQIMQQAATAMLAQANQMPNVVLSLLK
jgi:flagellin